jgi:hypothetical protein
MSDACSIRQSRGWQFAAVVAVVLVMLAAGPAVVGAQGSNGGGNKDKGNDKKGVKVKHKCTGGFFAKRTCQMMNSMIGWFLTMVADFVQGIITSIVNAIIGIPVPKHNGEPAIIQPPTNKPWNGLYKSWLTWAVPLGLLEWMLMVLGVLFSQVYVSDPATELQRRELKHRSWKMLFGILGSWAMGATVLHVANAVALTVAPDGKLVASSLGTFMANVQSVGLAAILIYVFGGVLFLFIILLLIAQMAVIFTLMWSLPVLIPLAAFDVGPIEPLSKPAQGIIDMFIPFAFLTLPMALVLRAGYVTINSLNGGTVMETALTLSGTNALLTLGFWAIAAVSPLFVFSQTGRIQGFAAGMLGAAVSQNVGETVQDAKDRVDWHVPPRYDNGPETHDPTDGRDASSHGGFGGDLGGGGTDRQTMLDAGMADQADDSGFAGPEPGSPGRTGTDPVVTSGSSSVRSNGGQTTGRTTESSSATSTGAETVSDRAVSSEDIVQVDHPRDLPSETKFNVRRVKDDGEFQPLPGDPDYTRSGLLNRYNRLNTTSHYQDEKLLVQSQEDGSYFDLDSMTYREQSYEQMSRETSEDVLNS